MSSTIDLGKRRPWMQLIHCPERPVNCSSLASQLVSNRPIRQARHRVRDKRASLHRSDAGTVKLGLEAAIEIEPESISRRLRHPAPGPIIQDAKSYSLNFDSTRASSTFIRDMRVEIRPTMEPIHDQRSQFYHEQRPASLVILGFWCVQASPWRRSVVRRDPDLALVEIEVHMSPSNFGEY
jgi:hypothetical protein